ncbi:MAG: bifunctional nuclease domain-containing protein [Candidatus Aenigmatarchaeota archaeon]
MVKKNTSIEKIPNSCGKIFLLIAVLVAVVFILVFVFSMLNLSIDSMVDDPNGRYSSMMEDYIAVDILSVNDTTVIVGSGCKVIIAETSEERARSISLGLAGKFDERPDAHDGMTTLLHTYNISLNYVVMHSLDNETTFTYYSDAVFQRGSDVLVLDMKPSDAFALALRMNSSIYINKMLLDDAGVNIC